ncbi:c-type cytochrome [Flavihumibacter fluvii]|uniref:c-type cytochrome n=1 Tax=Flavihumibacter fluvii TaxID=2838157 RepID=UPI001BDE705E|nr:c-type cytochrome [Flavihumibacter fluvii]ULQ50598.1 c-type cytochrome [Flavihumibacter fluvii]
MTPYHVNDPEKPVPIPKSVQRSGNAAKGFEYLTTGDYVKGGIPYDFYLLGKGKEQNNYLNRSGINSTVSHEFTVIRAGNGENLVAPNCLQCHAQVFNDSLIVGMGNTFMDFTMGKQLNAASMNTLGAFLKTTAPAKYEAAKQFLQVTATIGPYLQTAVRGVNAADRLAAVLVAHRDPQTLAWQDSASMDIPAEVIPSDVPAWWLLKKKNAMFYNGFGRGDFGRFLMASNLLTTKDSSEAAKVDKQISDVLEYLYTLEPPKYPGNINPAMAKKGAIIFKDNCSKCHGSYGEKEEYPNLLVPASIIKTDSALYSSNYQNPQFINWFNNSWFAQGDHPAKLVPFKGYIAPPLDGIWCTAPYLHNGSVPTLEGVLNSKIRPAYWSRDFSKPVYNYISVGWEYQQQEKPGGTTVYNTTLNGYGNYGHYFGDKLSDADRKSVIEYLKTL